MLCISVKLKNLKVNHNKSLSFIYLKIVVYIRKVKKSESKSQLLACKVLLAGVVYIRKVKKSESKSQLYNIYAIQSRVVYIRKVKKSESKSQHQGTCSTKIIFERNRGRLSTQLIRLS